MTERRADSIFSVAPWEGHKPIGILTDEHYEKMCNPTKYPSGKSGMMSNSWLLASTLNRDSLMQMGGCLPLLKECQRFTSLLSEGHVWCACDDQTAWFANLITHTVSSRHIVAGCHPEDRQTVLHHPHRRKCKVNVLWRKEQMAYQSRQLDIFSIALTPSFIYFWRANPTPLVS